MRVALEWSLDLFFNKDFVQYQHTRPPRQLIPIDDASVPVRPDCEVPTSGA